MKINRVKEALVALSLSLIQTTFNVGNQVKAIFVYNEKTSYCPYNQADHLVDGLLWHYDNKNNKAFFILARVVENKQFKFINNSRYLEDLKKNHFTEIDIDELRNNSNKNGGFDKYLYDSFVNAFYTNARISPKEQYPNVVESDFPLNNLAEYFDGYVNGDDYFFWRRIFTRSNTKGPVELLSKVYSSWNDSGIFGSDSFLTNVPLDKLKPAVDEISKSLVLSHGTCELSSTLNGHLSSLKTLRLTGKRYGNHTCTEDERLKNKGFIFTMLCSEGSKLKVGDYIKPNRTNLFFRNLAKLPIVVCSKDQLWAFLFLKEYSQPEYSDECDSHKNPSNRCPGDVYICSGKNLSSVMARHYFLSKNGKKYVNGRDTDFEKGYNSWSSKSYDGSAKNWLCECRIPTYLILSDDDFYKPENEE